MAANTAGQLEARVELEVQVAPRVWLHTRQEVSTVEGLEVTLGCEGWGDPTPRLEWLRGQEVAQGAVATEEGLEEGEVVTYLTLRAVTRAQAGLYQCRASSQAGASQVTVRLGVDFPPSFGEKVRVGVRVGLV